MRRLRGLGPGFVYVLTALGAGDLVSNSAAGAGYGYALIWTAALTLLFRFVWVNVSAKYVLVTGETLAQGYARVGRWVIWVMLVAGIITGHFSVMSMMVVCGDVAHLLFPLPFSSSSSLWSVCFLSAGFVMAYWGGYRMTETFCKVLIAAMVGCLLMVAIVSQPDPVEILRGAVVPTIPGSQGLYSSLLILMALIGTMAGSTTNLTYVYYMREKGWNKISHLGQQRFDLIFGVICLFLLAALLQIAAAATLQPLGVELEDASDLVRIFSEVQGKFGLIVFGLGLWGAAFSTLVGTLVGYGFVVADLSRFLGSNIGNIDASGDNSRRQPVYRACVIFWSISPLYVLLTGVSPVWLVLAVNSLFVVLIPLLTPVLLKLTNDKKLMGPYKNGLLTNAILVALLLVALYITAANLRDAFTSWF